VFMKIKVKMKCANCGHHEAVDYPDKMPEYAKNVLNKYAEVFLELASKDGFVNAHACNIEKTEFGQLEIVGIEFVENKKEG